MFSRVMFLSSRRYLLGSVKRTAVLPVRLEIIILFLLPLLVACALTQDNKKPADIPRSQNVVKVAEPAPQPGDMKLMGGVEYVYARNRRFNTTPYEPEYVWYRKRAFPRPF